ncbi:MAG: hypothetical protein R3E66_14825 [bacterium]
MADDDSDESALRTVQLKAVEGETVELDKYALLSSVLKDSASTDGETVRLEAVNIIAPSDMQPTIQMPAINADTTRPDQTPGIDHKYKTLQIELVPVEAEEATVPMKMTVEFDATIQPGGLIAIPAEFFGGGGLKVGMRLKITGRPT